MKNEKKKEKEKEKERMNIIFNKHLDANIITSIYMSMTIPHQD
jgi:hypothetical protein